MIVFSTKLVKIARAAFAGTMLCLAATAQPVRADKLDSSRIVAVGGAVTEILYALGLEANIVGVDTTSLYPPQALRDKPNVGYMRQLSAEGVLGLRPSMILAIDGSGPANVVSVLKAASVPYVTVPDAFTADSIAEKVRKIGEVTGESAKAECLASRVTADVAALNAMKSAIGQKKRVVFVLSLVNGRAMVAGRHTAADGIIALSGATNAIDEFDGYKNLNDEAIIAARPDVVLSIHSGGPGTMTADDVFANAGFMATPAGAARAFYAMDGLYLLGFGPRTVRAARDLASTLYPDLTKAVLPSERDRQDMPCRN